MKDSPAFSTVSEYIAFQPAALRKGLELLRSTIKKAAPDSEETISYNMPAYRQHAVLVYFAANKSHYGFYPTASPMEAFKEKLAGYNTSKGAIQFPLDQPIPVKLVTEMVKWRIRDDNERAAMKKAKPGAAKKKAEPRAAKKSTTK